MPNEFIVKNGLISQGNITISGSITATGGVTVSGSIASASYASNADLLDGLDSTVFTLTSSFNAQTASFTSFTSSMNSFSASILTNVTALNAKTASFATTGSNTFVGAEVISGSLAISGSGTPFTLNTDTLEITGSLLVTGSTTLTGSLLQLGNFTTTGTIIAQTINVQTVTSSIVYSSGSNVFGNSLGNSQTFTGSVLITGSLTIAGASSATSYNGSTIFGSTIACSPIGCFATSCATSFIGGTMSGTTIYGSTAVCSAVGKFTSCIDVGGSGTFSGNLTLAASTPGLVLNDISGTAAGSIIFQNSGTQKFNLTTLATSNNFALYNNGGTNSYNLQIVYSTGAATFSSTITGTTIYGSTAVCSPSIIACTTSAAAITIDGYSKLSFKDRGTEYGTINASRYNFGGESTMMSFQSGNCFIFLNGTNCLMFIGSNGNVGIGTTSTSTEANLFLGAQGANEGGQMVLQKGTSYQCATHIDNYNNCFRIMAGTNTSSAVVNMTIDHTTGNACFLGSVTAANGSVFGIAAGSGQAMTIQAGSNCRAIIFKNAGGGDGSLWLYGASNSIDFSFSTYSVSNAFYLYNNGNYLFAGSNVSDRRLKENIVTIELNAIEKINQLVPKSYNMIAHPEIKRHGLIAQEVKEIIPDFITGEETEKDYLGIDYNGILVLAVKAIQEQQCTICSQASMINTLKTCLGIN